MTKSSRQEFLRFVLLGGLNTGLTQLFYMALLLVMPYSVAYTISYVAGIYLSYYLNSRYVFKAPLHWKKAVQYPVVYLIQYLLGLGLVIVLIELLRVHEVIAPLIVVVLTLPVTFVVSRFIIRQDTAPPT